MVEIDTVDLVGKFVFQNHVIRRTVPNTESSWCL